MKKLLSVCCFTCCVFFSKAQNGLTNTKWNGVANIPSAADITFVFTADTLLMVYNDEAIETMSYRLSGDTLHLLKLGGMSPCSGEKGTYKFTVKEDKLVLDPISDDCVPRSSAFTPEGYTRVKP
jgi:hypothetical protein